MNKFTDNQAVNTIRLLGMDMINKAKSGHPGIVLGAAPIVHTLFTRHLQVDPGEEKWVNRDRFILSAGHGSAMLYAVLHLAGYNITLDNLRDFRQLGSLTPGHPEVGHTPGVEATTGPLGQGIAMAVGMAMGEKFLASKFNKYNNKIINHYTYVLCGDGDLQEGVCQEALSLAGTLNLSKLIILYDSNDIQLDGAVRGTNTENVKAKMEAMNFEYILVTDANDCDSVDKAITLAKQSTKPTLIEIKSQIGYGSPNAGDSAVHGSPLGAETTEELKEFLGVHFPESFYIPEEVRKLYAELVANRGEKANTQWNKQLSDYQDEYPNDYRALEQFINNEYELKYNKFTKYDLDFKDATRNIAGVALSEVANQIPVFLGGSADVAKSVKAKGANGDFSGENPSGRNILYGIREHAMGAIANGLTLHSNLRAFTGAFLVFSDYMKASMRLAALMRVPTLFVFSHDSIAVGEDGPTHQPIEQLTMLRSIPDFNTIRPSDSNETNYAFMVALGSKDTPVAIITSRQSLPTLANTSLENTKKGGYIIREEQGKLDIVVIACGSEVSLAIKTAEHLEKEKIQVRVVAMPSQYLFDRQSLKYRKQVLPEGLTVAIEMGHPMSWYKYTSDVYGIETFGYSGKDKDVMEKCGFTVDGFSAYLKKRLAEKKK